MNFISVTTRKDVGRDQETKENSYEQVKFNFHKRKNNILYKVCYSSMFPEDGGSKILKKVVKFL
jgi:hypothetical protein